MHNLVLLHGWGCDSRAWAPLLPGLEKLARVISLDLPGFGADASLEDYSLEAVLEALLHQLPDKAILMGWSLGGMLAVQLAARYPERVTGLITLAANLKFVAEDTYPMAMPPAVNRQFTQQFSEAPQATLKLFSGLLMQGDDNERALLKHWRRDCLPEPGPRWLAALNLLATLDNRQAFIQLTQPGLHLLAARDALVPVAAAEVMARVNPQQQVQVMDACAHALHWSQPDALITRLSDFLSRLPTQARLDKKKIAQSFSRAAPTYDGVAQLQRDVGTHLLSWLPDGLAPDSCVMDLGSGTGFFTQALAQRYPASCLFGVDLAEGMLQYARAGLPAPVFWIGGDAEALPLADESVDLIFSSLAIQWCNHLPRLMGELHRVLRPGGQLCFATLGPATLHELKSAWQGVDDFVHVNHFPAATEVCDALVASGLQGVELESQVHRLYFPRLADLTRELKALGAHNINSGKPEGLTGRARLCAFKQAYEDFRTPEGLPATYDVIYVRAQKNRC